MGIEEYRGSSSGVGGVSVNLFLKQLSWTCQSVGKYEWPDCSTCPCILRLNCRYRGGITSAGVCITSARYVCIYSVRFRRIEGIKNT